MISKKKEKEDSGTKKNLQTNNILGTPTTYVIVFQPQTIKHLLSTKKVDNILHKWHLSSVSLK